MPINNDNDKKNKKSFLLELNARSHRQKFLRIKGYFSSPRRIEEQKKGFR